MSRVAVWGASGFIGRHTVESLLARGHIVRALCRDPAALPPHWRDRVDARALAFDDTPEQMRAAVRGCDSVIHCAGHTQDEQALAVYERSVTVFCQAAVDSQVSRVLILSTVAVYGVADSAAVLGVNAPLRSNTVYGDSRIRAEKLARTTVDGSATRLVVVRVPAVVGVGMPGTMLRRFFNAIRWGVFLHPGTARATLGCIGVRRLADIFCRLVEPAMPPGVYQFAENVTWVWIADCFSAATGRRILRIPVPATVIAAMAAVFGASALSHIIGALSNQISYEDDSERLGLTSDTSVATTLDDLRAVIAHDLQRASVR